MSYKTILVHVDSDPRSTMRVELAIALARRFDAHVVGLNVQPLVRFPPYVAADPMIVEYQQRAAANEAAAAEALFRKVTAAAGLAGAEWHFDEDGLVDTIVCHARYADLLILGQRNPSESWTAGLDFSNEVLLAAGRPVLVVPYAGTFNKVGNRVLVAWNASREAARAVTDAIPLLREAATVRVITINPRGDRHGDLPGADIGLYLTRHGVRVEVTKDDAVSIDVGNELLSRAADFDADLIVMGAYGHSRLKELVMGGATRTIIGSMTVPVLLSH
jgi:nucleotide-binding universal stress UspA family protein